MKYRNISSKIRSAGSSFRVLNLRRSYRNTLSLPLQVYEMNRAISEGKWQAPKASKSNPIYDYIWMCFSLCVCVSLNNYIISWTHQTFSSSNFCQKTDRQETSGITHTHSRFIWTLVYIYRVLEKLYLF